MSKKKHIKMYLQLGEVSELLGVSVATCRLWAEAGFIPGYRYCPNRRPTWRFSREAILRLMQSCYRGKPGAEQPAGAEA